MVFPSLILQGAAAAVPGSGRTEVSRVAPGDGTETRAGQPTASSHHAFEPYVPVRLHPQL